MEVARQRVRAAAACKKEEEKATKGKDMTSTSTPKTIAKGSSKRKSDGKDERSPKKVAITNGEAHPKKKSPLSLFVVRGRG